MTRQATRQNNYQSAQVRTRIPTISAQNVHVQVTRRANRAVTGFSRNNVHRARAQAINAALYAFVDLVYEPRSNNDPILVNVTHTGRIRPPVPWGWLHYQDYGLAKTEQIALAWIMQKRSEPGSPITPMFFYLRPFWYLSQETYQRHDQALAHLEEYPVKAHHLAAFEDHQAGIAD